MATEHEHYPKEGLYRGAKEVWENDQEISAQLDKCYTTDLFAAGAKKFIIDQHTTNSSKPFFIYLAFDTPHAVDELPTQAFPSGKGTNGGLRWLGKSGQMINTASGKIDSYYYPDYANATYDDDGNANTPEVAWPDVYKRYAGAVRRVDDCVGDILQTLKDLRIDDNTLVVFCSDNGPSMESYLKQNLAADFFNSFGPFDGIKRDVWEGGIRMPTIAWWPKHIAPGGTSIEPSQIAGLDGHVCRCGGCSGSGAMRWGFTDSSIDRRRLEKPSTIYVEYFNDGKTPKYDEFFSAHRGRIRGQMQSVRIGDFQGVRYNIRSPADDFEIYNVVSDPQETKNLGATKNSPGCNSK